MLDQCKKYVKISKDEKKKSINVVFDGYSDINSTKDVKCKNIIAGQPQDQFRNQEQH